MANRSAGAAPGRRVRLRERLFPGKDRRRASWYDGSEKPDMTPPSRYARGEHPTPPPPPAVPG